MMNLIISYSKLACNFINLKLLYSYAKISYSSLNSTTLTNISLNKKS